MKQKIVLVGEEQRERALSLIGALPFNPIYEVIIQPKKKDRTAAQRGLYFMWVTQIAGHYGETKDDVHRRLKKKHLIPIYMEDPDSGMAELVMAVREVHKQGLVNTAKALSERIVDLVSTNDASVVQFTAYLDQIEKEHIQKGVYLVHPEDVWLEAMGR